MGMPLATTLLRRPSTAGASRLRLRRATFVATGAPASRQMRAAARSRGLAVRASMPRCAQANRWSPHTSSGPPHAQRLGTSGSGIRSLRSSKARYLASGTDVSTLVGRAVNAQLAASPRVEVCEKRLERAPVQDRTCDPAACCQPGRLNPLHRSVAPDGAATFSSNSLAQGGASNLCPRRYWATCSAARVPGGLSAASASRSGRTRFAKTPGWCLLRACNVSAQDAQYAACRCCSTVEFGHLHRVESQMPPCRLAEGSVTGTCNGVCRKTGGAAKRFAGGGRAGSGTASELGRAVVLQALPSRIRGCRCKIAYYNQMKSSQT